MQSIELDSDSLISILTQNGEAIAIYSGEKPVVNFMSQAMMEAFGILAVPTGKLLTEVLPPSAYPTFYSHLNNIWRAARLQEKRHIVLAELNGHSYQFTFKQLLNDVGEVYAIVHTAELLDETTKHKYLKNSDEEQSELLHHILDSNKNSQDIFSDLEQLASQNDDLRRSSQDIISLNDKLSESAQHFRILVEQAPVAILVFKGPQLIIEMANPPILDILDRTADIIGKPILESMPELRGEPAVELIFEVFRTGNASYGKEVPVRMLREGITETRYFNFTYRPMIDNGEIVGVMDIAVEVTEQVRSRQDLEQIIQEKTILESSIRASEQHLQRILDTMAEGVGLVDEKGELIYANQMAEKILGLSREEIKGRNYGEASWQNLRLDGTPLPDKEHPMSVMMVSGEPLYDQEIAVQQPNGERIYISINAAPVFDSNGTLTGGIGTFMDVTNRRKLAMQKDDFIGVASHELKTPVTSLKAALQLLTRMHDAGKHDISRKLIKQANKSMEKLTELTQALLDVSRMNHDSLQINRKKFDLVQMAKEYAANLNHGEINEIHFKGLEELDTSADEQQIEQVFVNFLTNAIKYAPNSKKIEVEVSIEHGQAKLSVKDFGNGIDAGSREKIFERYFRAENNAANVGGLGLGLYISSEIIKKHDGKIGLDTEIGKGSTFWFSVPIS